MIYYAKEGQSFDAFHRTAGIKARDDLYEILNREGFEEIVIPFNNDARINANTLSKLVWYFKIKSIWKSALSKLCKGDKLFIQFPLVEHSPLVTSVFKNIVKKGVEVYIFIHDLELLRIGIDKHSSFFSRIRLKIEEEGMLKLATKIVVHNNAMMKASIDMGINPNKIVVLKIFDYYLDDLRILKPIDNSKNPIVIAGNLAKNKALYTYALPKRPMFNLYGRNYEVDELATNINYRGSFESDELPYIIANEGSYGLVWDGESPDTCCGIYGEYIRVNNPHKTSLYLASGLPVIIWEKAALAEFIVMEEVGITISSLAEIDEKIANIQKKEYERMRNNAIEIGKNLRQGYFTKRAIEKCVE